MGRDLKGKVSPLIYAVGIAVSLWQAWAGQVLYALAALLCLVPDRRIERAVSSRNG